MAVLYRHIRLDKNEPFYIGIGKTEKRAYSIHSRNKHWKSIVNKHGYKVQIMLDDLTWEEACEKEREFIALYGRKEFGGLLCNLTDGGDGILNPSAETKQKMSEAAKGKTHSAETRAKLSAIQKGKPKPPFSAEHRAKMSEAAKGKIMSVEARAKMSAANKGKIMSAETKAKIGEASKGRTHSAETKAKISIISKEKSNLGRTLSAETKAKISEASKGKPKSPRSAEHCAKISARVKLYWQKKVINNS